MPGSNPGLPNQWRDPLVPEVPATMTHAVQPPLDRLILHQPGRALYFLSDVYQNELTAIETRFRIVSNMLDAVHVADKQQMESQQREQTDGLSIWYNHMAQKISKETGVGQFFLPVQAPNFPDYQLARPLRSPFNYNPPYHGPYGPLRTPANHGLPYYGPAATPHSPMEYNPPYHGPANPIPTPVNHGSPYYGRAVTPNSLREDNWPNHGPASPIPTPVNHGPADTPRSPMEYNSPYHGPSSPLRSPVNHGSPCICPADTPRSPMEYNSPYHGPANSPRIPIDHITPGHGPVYSPRSPTDHSLSEHRPAYHTPSTSNHDTPGYHQGSREPSIGEGDGYDMRSMLLRWRATTTSANRQSYPSSPTMTG